MSFDWDLVNELGYMGLTQELESKVKGGLAP